MVSGRIVRPDDTCPHGSTLGECQQLWCRSRMEDLEQPEYKTGEYKAPPLTDGEKH
jgi:hypothetical protein